MGMTLLSKGNNAKADLPIGHVAIKIHANSSLKMGFYASEYETCYPHR